MRKQDPLSIARYIAVTSKILNIRIALSGFPEESREQFAKYSDGEYVSLNKVPTKELVNYFYRMSGEYAYSEYAKILSRQVGIIPIQGPEGSAVIIAEQVEFVSDPEKTEECVKRLEKEHGKGKIKKFSKGTEEIIDVLDHMDDDEKSWETLYKMLDEGMLAAEEKKRK
jgi:hypothetical protein